jgi:NhaP-type Na+/H+ or K+/H+ antiporter
MSVTSSSETAGALGILLILVSLVIWVSHICRRVRWVNTGSLALGVGLVAGGLSWVVYEGILGRHVPQALVAFQYEIYMDLLLPIIIYQMGFSTKKHSVFSNLGALMTLGVLGTIVSTILIGVSSYLMLRMMNLDDKGHVANSLALGAILSSTDSIAALQSIHKDTQPELYALTFGEGIFNDATSIVLLRSVQKIHSFAQMNMATLTSTVINFVRLFAMSLLLGFGMGLLSALVLKRSFSGTRHSTDKEVSVFFLLGLSSYLLAERLHLSGIFSVFFCGLTQSHYAWYNLSASAKVVSIYSARIMSLMAETMLFLGCGLDLYGSWDTIDYTKASVLQTMIVLAPFFFILIFVVRFSVTFPLIYIVNMWRRNRIENTEAWMLSLAGCSRGAVTLALCINHFMGGNDHIPKNERILSASCILITICSTMGLGTVIPLVFDRWQQDIPPSNRSATGRPQSHIESTHTSSKAVDIKRIWLYYDRTYLQPLFGGRSMQALGEHPPSPGRWRGVQSTLEVIQGDFDAAPTASYVNQHEEILHEEESSIHGGNDDLLEPLFSVISDVQAAEEAEENIDSLITGKTRQ